MPHYEQPTHELEEQKKLLGYYPKPADFVPNPTFPKGHIWHGRKRCTKWNVKKGRQCLKLAAIKIRPDFDKCMGCGGSNLRGEAHPNFKHGRDSKYVTKLPNVPDYLRDPLYLSLIDEIAVLRGRIQELLSTVDVGESAKLWIDGKKTFVGMKKAIRQGDTDAASEKMTDLETILIRGNKTWAKWEELQRSFDLLRKLVDTDRKRVEGEEASMRAERVLALYENLSKANRVVIIDRLDALIGHEVSTVIKQRLLSEIFNRFREFNYLPNGGNIQRAD